MLFSLYSNKYPPDLNELLLLSSSSILSLVLYFLGLPSKTRRCQGVAPCQLLLFCLWRKSPPPSLQRAMASSFTRFLDHTHNDAPQSVGLLWTSDQPDSQTPICTTYNTHSRHICPGGIRTRILSRRAAAHPRLRPRGHRDWHPLRT